MQSKFCNNIRLLKS